MLARSRRYTRLRGPGVFLLLPETPDWCTHARARPLLEPTPVSTATIMASSSSATSVSPPTSIAPPPPSPRLHTLFDLADESATQLAHLNMTTPAEAARARIEREACMRAITNFANVLHVSPEEAALIEGVRQVLNEYLAARKGFEMKTES